MSGIAFNIACLGLSTFMREVTFGLRAGVNASRTPPFPTLDAPWLIAIPIIGPILAEQTILTLVVLILPFLAVLVLHHSGMGLRVRIVGESARTADAVGINVDRTRLAAVVVGSMCASLGGVTLTLVDVNYFITNITEGRGYMALAAIILARWEPVRALAICLIIGAADAVQFRVQAMSWNIIPQLVLMLPYLVVLLMIVLSRGASVAPADNGKPFIRS